MLIPKKKRRVKEKEEGNCHYGVHATHRDRHRQLLQGGMEHSLGEQRVIGGGGRYQSHRTPGYSSFHAAERDERVSKKAKRNEGCRGVPKKKESVRKGTDKKDAVRSKCSRTKSRRT